MVDWQVHKGDHLWANKGKENGNGREIGQGAYGLGESLCFFHR